MHRCFNCLASSCMRTGAVASLAWDADSNAGRAGLAGGAVEAVGAHVARSAGPAGRADTVGEAGSAHASRREISGADCAVAEARDLLIGAVGACWRQSGQQLRKRPSKENAREHESVALHSFVPRPVRLRTETEVGIRSRVARLADAGAEGVGAVGERRGAERARRAIGVAGRRLVLADRACCVILRR